MLNVISFPCQHRWSCNDGGKRTSQTGLQGDVGVIRDRMSFDMFVCSAVSE